MTEDADGNIGIAGVFTGMTTLGDFSFSSAGGSDIFVIKITPSSTGIVRYQIPASISIYPNPAKDEVWFDYTPLGEHVSPSFIVITDMTGKLLLRVNVIEHTTSLDVSLLPPGLYAVAFYGSRNTVVTRLVIQ